MPHAETNTIVLPHTVAYNSPATVDAMARLADDLPESNGDAVNGLNVLLEKLRTKRTLRDIGMPKDGTGKTADLAMMSLYANPRQLEKDKIMELIRRAWNGEAARADM